MPFDKNNPWTIKNVPVLGGKLAIVTGATSGIGLETALGLAEAGATVILAGRSDEKGRVALEKIQGLLPTAAISFENVDLGSLASIADFCRRINARNQAVHFLVNNAGVMMPPTRQKTSDGFELQFGTNHLSHFALTAQLLPSLMKAEGSRVVNVSSIAHRQGKMNWDDIQAEKSYSPYGSYSQSKLANLLFTLEFQRRSEEGGWGVTAISAHPGISRTELINNGPGDNMMGKLFRFTQLLFSQDAAHGALPSLFAALATDAQPGAYYGPNGFNEMKGPVALAQLTKEAKDPESAKKLWDISVSLTGVTWP